MSKPSEAKLKWLRDLAGMGGEGGGSAVLLTKADDSHAPVGPIGAALGNQSTPRAAPAPGSLKPQAGSPPPASTFVPDLEIVGGPRRELAVNGKITMQLNVRNWAKRPKGATLVWTVTSSDSAVDFDYDRVEGECTITVTGLKAGKGVVKVDVKVDGGATYRFSDLVFTVSPTAKDPATFVPDLETPQASKRDVLVGGEITLQLKVRNWDKRPKGTILDWSVSSSGTAVDYELEHRGGEGTSTVTVKGLKAGQGVIKAEVKVKGGGTYPFSETVLTVADEGGIASVTDLEQDMRNILQDWKGATSDGIQQFATNALSARLDKLESGSATNFLTSLLGNTIWAAAAFSTGGVAFAISMGGIAVAAAPTVPEESKSFIPTIQKAMVDHIYEVYDQLDKSLRKKAQVLVDGEPGISRFRALSAFVAASFKPAYCKVDAKNTKIPILNKAAIRDVFESEATRRLDEAIKADEARKKAARDRRNAEYANRPGSKPY